MFLKNRKYKKDCVQMIMQVSGLSEKNAEKFFASMKKSSEYIFTNVLDRPAMDVITAFILVFNETYHMYTALGRGEVYSPKLARSGDLPLLSLITIAYHAGKNIPSDPILKKHVPQTFDDRYNDFCSVMLPTVSKGMVPIKVWMEDLPLSETVGIAVI